MQAADVTFRFFFNLLFVGFDLAVILVLLQKLRSMPWPLMHLQDGSYKFFLEAFPTKEKGVGTRSLQFLPTSSQCHVALARM